MIFLQYSVLVLNYFNKPTKKTGSPRSIHTTTYSANSATSVGQDQKCKSTGAAQYGEIIWDSMDNYIINTASGRARQHNCAKPSQIAMQITPRKGVRDGSSI